MRKTLLIVALCLILAFSWIQISFGTESTLPTNVMLACDEEFWYKWAGMPKIPAVDFAEWTIENQVSVYFEEAFGISIDYVHDEWVLWDSDNSIGDVVDLLLEAIDETGFYSGMVYNGRRIDVLVAWSGQDVSGMGLGVPYWNACIVDFAWYVFGFEINNVLQHELSHVFGALHCHNDCVMNIDGDHYLWTNNWCDDCFQTINANKFKFNPFTLTIQTTTGGTTEPSSGTYAYSYGESVTVTASAYSGYTFNYWILDGATKYGNPITVTMNSDHTLRACFQYNGGGGSGCPILSVYSGTGYVEEGLLDIHNPDGIDQITSHVLIHTPEPVENRYLLRLTEHPQTYSHLDQVRLFAMLTNGTEVKLSLVSAIHSEYGNVKQKLLVSDDVRAVMLGEDWNNGTSQYIDLKFVAPDELEIETFTFIIEGHNVPEKEAW